MKERWHKFVHSMNWHRGEIVSMTAPGGEIFIGFQCDKCGNIGGIIEFKSFPSWTRPEWRLPSER